MSFFKKTFPFITLKSSPFHIFQKREQKKIWKQAVLWTVMSLVVVLILSLYLLLAPFKGFFAKAPTMLGFTGTKEYLIVLQNNAERRPTGGFISAYAELSFFAGFPSLTIKDSYTIEAPKTLIQPPYPLNELLKDDVFYKGWVFRDANWSPDFSVSSKSLIELYNAGKEVDEQKDFDGVISVDISVIEELLALVGSLQIGDILVDRSNLFHLSQVLSKNIDLHSVDDLESRKDFMKDFAPILMKELVKSPLSYSKILQTIKRLFDEKHIQLFFQKDSWQAVAENNDWAGRFKPNAEDFVHVNVANIGGRKADRYIQPDYHYTVSFDEHNQATANVDLYWRYPAAKGLYTDFYQAYVRTYLPKNISDLKKWGDFRSDFVVEKDLDATSVGTLIHMWPGETQSLHFSYTLPSTVMPFTYNLEIIPMAGSNGEEWSLNVINKNTDTFWNSKDFTVTEHVAKYFGIVKKNRLFHVEQAEDKSPPVIIWQKFLDKNTIELSFSEKLHLESLKAEHFSLKDKNIKVLDIQNTPVIRSVSQEDDYRVIVKVQNIDWQYEEYFSLSLENIADIAGNMIEPNPKEITLIQR